MDGMFAYRDFSKYRASHVGEHAILSRRNQIPNWRGASDAGEVGEVAGEGDALKDLLRRLVRGEERYQLEVGGFTCHFDLDAEMCLSAKPVRISNGGLTVHVPSDGSGFTRSVRPYARIGDELAMKLTTPVQILHRDMANLPACNFTHSIPAVIFSTGVTGNAYHELSEIIIPLFLACRHFRSQLKFVATDYNEWWIRKYSTVLNRLSDYEALDLSDGGVHCFPAAVVGLRYHGNLALNASNVPLGHSMPEFRQFLRESYNLKTKNVHEIDKLHKPVLILISRTNSRKILNEDAIVELAQELGFQVVTAGPSMMSNLELFAKMVSSCSVFIGVHGAGLTNEIFLPDGAVVIQVVLLGLEWGSTNYYGSPATAMGLQYLEYKIEPQESSLAEVYGLDHPVIVDPLSVFAKGYMAVRAVYVDGQDVKINLDRFKATLEEAMRLVGHSTT
ncbi:alpha-1,3-arabinosyltransferase XAT2-like isoform X1 [Rhodamnia argentea]|uniref:Alpha-1,3-arabinosyltransferase XAT2-like isoform X1 n=1 Tax=Rhodamnia argentea TaxID=178133 RepID=A0A8B8NPL6_9MYRT|nr:alpha-1,3-arabinosyltransferase XAT2-like isoform X1 [Rhodamnia argentea]